MRSIKFNEEKHISGLGLGFIMTAGYSCFNLYFVKKRVFMMSLLQASKGVIVALYPIIVKTLMNIYGYQGAMAIMAAINAHAIVGMLLLHPIEWHYKVVKVPEMELQSRKPNRLVFFFFTAFNKTEK